MKEHIIQSGQTIDFVAKQNKLPISVILRANPGIDPKKLKIGQKIMIPEEDELLTELSKVKTKKGEVVSQEQLGALVESIAQSVGIRKDIFKALVSVESKGDFSAKSKAGAVGLSQIMPDKIIEYGITDPHDLKQNLTAGAKVLNSAYLEMKTLKNKNNFKGFGFNTPWELALMIYHGGAPNVQRWLNAGAPTNLDILNKKQKTQLGGFGQDTLNYPKKIIASIGITNPFPKFKGY